MRSHLSAFGLGAGLVLLVAGVIAIAGKGFIQIDRDDDDGVSVVNFDDGDSGSFQLRDGAVALAAKWKGEFAFAGDGRSLTTLARSLEVEIKEGDVLRRAVFENQDGKIRVTAFRNEATLADAAAGAEAAALLQNFARSSGVNADQRLKALVAAGGKAAAMEEIGALAGGPAASAYIGALAELATLDDRDIEKLTAQVASLGSDYAKRRALSALLRHQKLSEAGVQKLLAAAKTIKSGHEVRLIVEALAASEMSPANTAAATALLAAIESDHEVRLAAEALIRSNALRPADAARAAAAALGAIDGDYEKRLVVEAASKRLGDAGFAAAVIAGAESIEGAHDRRLAIAAIADHIGEDPASWTALIALVGDINGDHERRLAIEAIAARAPQTAEVKAALARAAAAISSDHDRRLAQDALD